MAENNVFEQIVKSSVNLPFVHVGRTEFLKKELAPFCTNEEIEKVLSDGTKGIVDKKVIDKIAKGCISYHTTLVCSTSFLAGIPGGWAMAGAIPADIAQFYGHVFALTQKLLYLYGWPDLSDGHGKVSDSTVQVLILFTGVMMGVQGADAGIKAVLESLAKATEKKIAIMVLKDSVVFQIAKKVAALIGVKLTREGFAKAAGKVIPLVGAPVSAGLTYFTFKPMTTKLKRHLDGLWHNGNL